MSLSDDKFISVEACGNDWREATKLFIEKCTLHKNYISNDSVLFLYITDNLAENSESIITLISSVTGISNIFGTVSPAIFNNSNFYINRAGIMGMIANFPKDSFKFLPLMEENRLSDEIEILSDLNLWMDNNDPRMMMFHAYPHHESDIMSEISEISNITNSFLAGGVTVSRNNSTRFLGTGITESAATGMLFSDDVFVNSCISQGCTPINETHIITSCEDNIIREIDNMPATDVLKKDIDQMIEDSNIDFNDDENINPILKGEIQVAFPIQNTDMQSFYVRSLVSADIENGTISLTRQVSKGDNIMFVHRDSESIRSDLSKSLVKLRERMTNESGIFSPKGGIYISCIARSVINEEQDSATMEMDIIQDVLGEDVPIVGHYAGGEISNQHLYGFTGLLILFG